MTPAKAGFRLGIYVFKDAEVLDFTAPYGVFSVARRFDPELDAFLVSEALRRIQTQAPCRDHHAVVLGVMESDAIGVPRQRWIEPALP